MKLTRRELAAALASTAVSAQTQSEPAVSPPPASPQDELKAAQDRNRNNAEALAKMQVPMDVEPAFQFKA